MKTKLRIALVAGWVAVCGIVRVQAQYAILHEFTGGATDASNPTGSLLLSGTNLFGMTPYRGIGSGVVFRVNTDGTGYTNLHRFFGGVNDGAIPFGSLTLSGTKLYGMTQYGGASNCGTFFSINTDGSSFTNLHSFKGSPIEGANPAGSLTLSGTKFYGLSVRGGSNGFGVVFRINNDGSGYTNLHIFSSADSDAREPYGDLVLSNATLYGMTTLGGIGNNGIIFKVNTNGSGFSTLHSFGWAGGASDGSQPQGTPTLLGSALYGMTLYGGVSNNGVLYRINTDGTGYTNLHVFTGGWYDGAQPFGSLTLSGSTFYGATSGGGRRGAGILFKIKSDGSGFTILHHFNSGLSDGSGMMGSLALSNATLYGMTWAGGGGDQGVLFSLQTNLKILLQQGVGGLSGVWTLGTNYQPAVWTPVNGPLGGSWALQGMNQSRILLQNGTGGLIGLWGTSNNVPTTWSQVNGPLAGWIARDVDDNRILLQQGNGGMVGIWTLRANNTPATWTQLALPSRGLIARALSGNRVLVQFSAGTPFGYWTLDAGNNIIAWTQLNVALPAGWILRDLTQNYILLQAGDGGMVGIWGLDANGVPNAWYPVTGAMPGWIMRAIEEQ